MIKVRLITGIFFYSRGFEIEWIDWRDLVSIHPISRVFLFDSSFSILSIQRVILAWTKKIYFSFVLFGIPVNTNLIFFNQTTFLPMWLKTSVVYILEKNLSLNYSNVLLLNFFIFIIFFIYLPIFTTCIVFFFPHC